MTLGILGIDPGAVSGGCAMVLINDGAAPQLVDAIDLPVIGVKAKQRIDVLALRTWIQQHKPDHAVIERGQAMPRQGASSGFKFGRGCGALEATIQLLEIPMTIVEASMWKRKFRLHGGDKEGAAACSATVSDRACAARAPKRPRKSRGRADRNRVGTQHRASDRDRGSGDEVRDHERARNPGGDMNAHSPFGGSVAARVLHCPASVGLIERVPAYLRKVSAYADRGTALHAAITSLLAEDAHARVESLAGKTFGSYVVTSDDVEDCLRPAYSFAESLLDAPGAEYFLEQRVVFPTIADTFGTLDVLVRIDRTMHVVDFKFGAGVRVLALSPADDDRATDIINSQLLFYAAAARHSLPAFFAGIKDIVLTIVQPISIDLNAEMISSVAVTHAELDAFIAAYRVACAEALSDTPHLEPGSWCRFCPARPICPAHTRPLLDLAQFKMLKPLAYNGAFATPPAKELYLQTLADGLNLVDAVKDIRVALHDQAKRALENGDSVPGYALSAGRAERHWCDEIVAQVTLLGLGFDHDDIIEAEMMRSPKQVELRAKARGLKVPQELIVSARSGVSLVKAENVRVPVLGRAELARMFSEALAAFQGGRQP